MIDGDAVVRASFLQFLFFLFSRLFLGGGQKRVWHTGCGLVHVMSASRSPNAIHDDVK